MPSITKPTATSTQTADMNQSLAKLQDAIDAVKTSQGTVNVKKLEAKLADDPMTQQAFSAIKDKFSHTETRVVSSCGGSNRKQVKVDPTTLKAEEVQDVMTALIAAKRKATGLDRNRDGKISAKEAKHAANLKGLSGEMIRAAIEGTRDGYKAALERWCEKLQKTAETVEARQGIENEITDVADFHAATASGAKALKWAFRDLATAGKDQAVWQMDNVLKRADTNDESPLLHMLFGRKRSTKKGHLSNREIQTLLNVKNLGTYARQTAAAVKDRVGGVYASFYLKGKDLPGAGQLKDPDFVEYRDKGYGSGC